MIAAICKKIAHDKHIGRVQENCNVAVRMGGRLREQSENFGVEIDSNWAVEDDGGPGAAGRSRRSPFKRRNILVLRQAHTAIDMSGNKGAMLGEDGVTVRMVKMPAGVD
jgi:hypothetical protein